GTAAFLAGGAPHRYQPDLWRADAARKKRDGAHGAAPCGGRTMNGICNELGRRLLYFDGGMGTLLQAMGLSGGERPETWNLIYPDRIAQVHRRYLEAGCDIVTTNTFGATSAHLGEAAQSCMRAGVRIAREAVSRFMRGY